MSSVRHGAALSPPRRDGLTASQTLARQEREQEALRVFESQAELARLRGSLDARRQQLEEVEQLEKTVREQSRVAQVQQGEVAKHAVRLHAVLATVRGHRATLQAAREKVAAAQQECTTASQHLSELARTTSQTLASQRADLASAKTAHSQHLRQVQEVNSQLSDAETRARTRESQVSQLQQDSQTVQSQLAEVGRQLQQLEEEQAARRAGADAARTQGAPLLSTADMAAKYKESTQAFDAAKARMVRRGVRKVLRLPRWQHCESHSSMFVSVLSSVAMCLGTFSPSSHSGRKSRRWRSC